MNDPFVPGVCVVLTTRLLGPKQKLNDGSSGVVIGLDPTYTDKHRKVFFSSIGLCSVPDDYLRLPDPSESWPSLAAKPIQRWFAQDICKRFRNASTSLDETVEALLLSVSLEQRLSMEFLIGCCIMDGKSLDEYYGLFQSFIVSHDGDDLIAVLTGPCQHCLKEGSVLLTVQSGDFFHTPVESDEMEEDDEPAVVDEGNRDLRILLDYVKQDLKDSGGCDHGVGICVCSIASAIERLEQ